MVTKSIFLNHLLTYSFKTVDFYEMWNIIDFYEIDCCCHNFQMKKVTTYSPPRLNHSAFSSPKAPNKTPSVVYWVSWQLDLRSFFKDQYIFFLLNLCSFGNYPLKIFAQHFVDLVLTFDLFWSFFFIWPSLNSVIWFMYCWKRKLKKLAPS